MIKNKKILLSMFFIFGIFIFIFFVSAYSQSAYSSQYNNAMGLGVFSSGQSLKIDESMCQQGTDFILQIGPLSCTPTVVRSDLLEEEDVRVFCQLTATQINPFVDIKAIDWITFKEEYPREVMDIGYQPARAALGYTEHTGLEGSALLNNLGYMVITLRKQPNESALRNCEKTVFGGEVCWVEGNLTANLRYDIENAFGVGKAVFYLPEMDDEEWEENYVQYTFWGGRGYLRAEAVGDEDARISIYSDNSIASGLSRRNREYNLAKYSSNINLDIGKPSDKIFLPGISPCLASLKLTLNGIENPETRAVLKINEDYIEVAKDEKFLDNKCTVTGINKKGLNSEVTIRCNGADLSSERKTFNLRIFPRVNLSIDGKTKSYGVGEWLYKSKDGEKSVYLGYVGTEKDTTNIEDLYVYLVSLPVHKDALTDSEIASVENHAEGIMAYSKSGANFWDKLSDIGKEFSARIMQVGKWTIKGESFNRVLYKEKLVLSPETKVEEIIVSLKGFANVEDEEFAESEDGEGYKENYDKAMSDFETVINSFSQETENKNSETLGEKSLYEEIYLAKSIGQKKTMLELCKKYEEDYPAPYNYLEICNDYLKLSSSEKSVKDVTINGITKTISFDKIKEPSINDYSATLLVQGTNGEIKTYNLRKNKQVPLSGLRINESELQGTEYVMLADLGTDSADIKLSLGDQNFFQKQFVSDTVSFKKGISQMKGGYTFTVTDIKLGKVAKVSISPSTEFAKSETSFKFKIGIEKRAIQLSPERAQEKINSLNDTMAKWQKASDVLYTVVKDMKAACVGAGAVLTFKNLINNRDGKSIARQEVMASAGGWNDKCAELISAEPERYTSLNDCFLENSDAVERDVDRMYNLMEYQNNEIKKFENANMQEGSGLAQNYVNTTGFVEDYSEQVRNTFMSLPEDTRTNLKAGEINSIITSDGWKNNKYTIEQLREIELYSLYLNSNPNDVTAMNRMKSVLADVNNNAKSYVQVATVAEQMGIDSNKINYIEVNKNVQKYPYEGLTAGNTMNTNLPSTILSDTPIAVVQTEQGTYTLVLNNNVGTKYYPVKYNEISQTVDGKETKVLQWQIYDSKGILVEGEANKEIIDRFKSSVFQIYDKSSYENKYKSSYGSPKSEPLLKYYETSPYKGLPAVVPFDTANGWYAGIKSPQTSYDASGRVVSFWVCNVGEKGIEEFQLEGFGNDICELFNTNTGQKYTQFPGLDETKTLEQVTKANDAIQAAQRAYKEGVTSVLINGKKIKVGEPSVQTSAVQCTDFMSPKDCNLLFNLCDPVICPSSRCNLGGNYNVQNVIQSGIIGSIVLCYPNAKWNGGDVYIPVCLTGVQAGIDSWISIQQSYKDCLQRSLDTGETVGICDEINSIYTCEFFWKQALPLMKYALPKLLGTIMGQNKKGGGEYQGINSALETAGNSIDYFKQYYAADSYRAFKIRSTEDVGTELCGTFASITYPDGGSFLDNLIEPDSPVQFTGKFDEIPLTTATNPPTSQYKVYYHIYAGKDSGAYYKVYLRGSGSSYYQDTAQNRIVSSGYIPKGEYKSETIDFTSPSGYKELCIVVNGQEECGFKEVSTSFAVNYVSDLYLAEQATANVTTEKECISGTASFYSLLNLNAESIANNLIDPAIYAQGIIRICATDDPGVGTDASAGIEGARWKKVGYCGNTNIGCWIDTESVKDVIKTKNIEEDALKEVSEDYLGYLSKNYLGESEFNSKIDEIKNEDSDTERITLIQEIFDKVFFNNQKAQLFFWRGKSYSNLAIGGYQSIAKIQEASCKNFCGDDGDIYYGIVNLNTGICEKSNKRQKSCVKGCHPAYDMCVEDLKVDSEGNIIPPTEIKTNEEKLALAEFNANYISPEIKLNDGKILTSNYCYRYYNSKWQWADCQANNKVWHDADNYDKYIASDSILKKPEKVEEVIRALQNYNRDYFGGLKVLVDKVAESSNGELSDESFETTIMNNEGIFTVKFSDVDYQPMKKIYYKYENDKWFWEIGDAYEGGGVWQSVSNIAPGFNEEQKTLVKMLKDKTLYQGAAILFDYASDDIKELFNIEIILTQEIFVVKPTLFQKTKGDTNLYYKYENGWKWTPYIEFSDNTIWMSAVSTVVRTGEYAGKSPSDKNIEIIESINDKSYAYGKKIIKDNGGEMENGDEIILSTIPIDEGCTISQTKCVGTTYYTCVDNAWVSQGEVNEECEYFEIFMIKPTFWEEIKSTGSATRLYYKYDAGWYWTPYSDKSVWMSTSTTVVASGEYKGKSPTDKNIEIIELINGKNYVDGKKILKENDGTMEDGSAISLGSITPVVVCTASQTKCEGTTYFTCLNNAWISKGLVEGKCGYTSPASQVCTPPEISSEVLQLNEANEKVLKAAEEAEGQSSSKAFYSNCWESAYYVYTSAGVSHKCVYSDLVGKEYSVQGNTINIGLDKKNGNIIYQIASSPKTQCSLNKQLSTIPTENQKLDAIQPGDLLSIVYDADDGHNVIFVEWIDKSNKIAKLFDWNGVDKNGNKIFRYYQSDLSDNQHAVYMYWEPVA